MHWVRRWQYELRWAPGHRGGMLSREVDTITQLRAVVEWARGNEHVIKYSFKPVDHLEGERVANCRHGHSLEAPNPLQPYRWRQDIRRFACDGCPGHDVTACTCGDLVIEPPPGHGCAAVPMGVTAADSAESARRAGPRVRSGP